MLYLRKSISFLLSQAASKAFPINETADIRLSQSKNDFVSNIATNIFNKYQKQNTSFGLFNSREVADCIFVNCSKNL